MTRPGDCPPRTRCETIATIVLRLGRRGFDTSRAARSGFRAETSFDDIVRAHVEDELGGKVG